TVTVTVTDKDGDGGSNSADHLQGPLNTEPSVETTGPYSVDEGTSTIVSATGTDPEGDELTYEWDLDNDGQFETAGQEVIFFALTLNGPTTKTIRVRATDTGNLSGVAETTVNVVNVAPVVDPPQVSPTTSAPGEFVAVNAEFYDPASADGGTWTFNFCDGWG